MKRRLAALALAMLLCLPLTACQKQQKLYSATWFDLFDTVAVVQGYAASQQDWDRQAAVLYDGDVVVGGGTIVDVPKQAGK